MDDSGLTSKLPPVIIAFIAGVGFSYTLLFPAYLGSERLQFEQARRDTAAWTPLRDTLLAEKGELQKQLAWTTKKLRQAEMATVFQFGNVYPTGLSDVRLGDPASAIERVYPGRPINKDQDGDMMVSVEHGAVSAVYYVLNHRASQNAVVSIMFVMKTGDDGALAEMFTTMFGAPTQEDRRAKYWNLPSGVQIRASGTHYSISNYVTSSTKRMK